MEINYLLIEEENEQDFASVLPPELNREENRICIGIVDEKNTVLGLIPLLTSVYLDLYLKIWENEKAKALNEKAKPGKEKAKAGKEK